MKKLIVAVFAACMSIAFASAYAGEEMKKDAKKEAAPKKDEMKKDEMAKDDAKKKGGKKKDEPK